MKSGDKSNWIISTAIALALHGAAMIAIVGQMKAGVPQKPETEISIVSLPSLTANVDLIATRVEKTRPDIVDIAKPEKQPDFQRLTPDRAQPDALSSITKAKKAEIAAGDKIAALVDTGTVKSEPVFDNAETIAPAQDAEELKSTEPVEATPVSNSDKSNPITNEANPIVPVAEANPVVPVADTSPVTPVEDANEVSAISPENALPAALDASTITPAGEPGVRTAAVLSEIEPSQRPEPEAAAAVEATDEVMSSSASFAETSASETSFDAAAIAENSASAPRSPAPDQAARPPNQPVRMATASPEITRKTALPSRSSSPTRSQPSTIATPVRDANTPSPPVSKPKSAAILKQARPAEKPVYKKAASIVKSAQIQPANSAIKNSVSAVRRPRPTTVSRTVRRVRSTKISRATRPKPSRASTSIAKKPKTISRTNNRPVKTEKRFAAVTRPPKVIPTIRNIKPPTREEKLGRVRQFLSASDTGNCFVALPGAVRNNKVGVYGFTKSSGLWPGFLQKLGQKTRLEVPAKLATITDAQCLVASFARQTRSYPNFTVSIVLAEDNIESGDFLEGALNNVKGRYLNLILVDDEGIAQRLNAYLFNKDTTPQFSLPVSSTSGPIATAQLLLAVVTDRELRSAAIYDPMPVSEFLYDLEQEIIEQGLEVDLAIAAFTVN